MSGYFVTTYDPELQEFTPQIGVYSGPYETIWAIRPAIRQLRAMGYETTRSCGVSVLVEKRKDSMHQIHWRRGGAQANPEVPIVGGERFTEIFTASVGIDSCLLQRRSLGTQWKPGGKWWRECKWWCYQSEIEGTLPADPAHNSPS